MMRVITAACCALLLSGTIAKADDNPIGGFFKKLFSPSQPSPPQQPAPAQPEAKPPVPKKPKVVQKPVQPQAAKLDATPKVAVPMTATPKAESGAKVDAGVRADAEKPAAEKPRVVESYPHKPDPGYVEPTE